jgi:gluconokinase
MSIVLAIDMGTTSTKALAVTQKGHVLFSTRESYSTWHPSIGYAEQSPEEIYQAVRAVIRSCPATIKKKITAISFSSAMHGVMAVDESGTPLSPLMIWSDLRSKAESQQVRNDRESVEQLARTGTPLHPMSPLFKIMWLRKNQPEVFSKAHKFIGIKEYVWFRFFGRYEVDQGIASATGFLETGKLSWFKPALSCAGIEAKQLSDLVSVYHSRKFTDQSVLNDLGFEQSIPCVIGSSDGCLANLGSFAMDADTLSLTLGTSGAVRRVVRENFKSGGGKVFHYHLDERTLIEGGATNNGAALIDWFSKKFLKAEINEENFVQQACRIPAGAEGLIFLPYVYGERAPFYNPEATGVFYGIGPHHTREHFMRALLEGIGLALYHIAESVERSSGPYHQLKASGGFIHSPEWLQIVADIFGKPVDVYEQEDASALGAAMMGFKAVGIKTAFPNPEPKQFQPNLLSHEKYQAVYLVFKKLSTLLNDAF